MNTKSLTFAIMMGALGAALFAISYTVAPIAPSYAFDLSLIGVLVAGYYGGPKIGFLTGLIAGVLPGIMFGPLGTGGAIGLIALPIGKALTGMTVGLLSGAIGIGKSKRLALLAIPVTFLAYLPEALFTWGYFILVMGGDITVGTGIYATIVTKALIEVGIMSVIMVALLRNTGFSSYVRNHFFSEPKPTNPHIETPPVSI
jgi:riboflavin transporter FmnP